MTQDKNLDEKVIKASIHRVTYFLGITYMIKRQPALCSCSNWEN